MTMLTTARATGRRSTGARPAALLDRLVRWDARYRERRHLETLPDAALRDTGLDRQAVAAEAGKPFWVE